MGVFITVVIRDGLNLMGVSPFRQGTATGTIPIVAPPFERLAPGGPSAAPLPRRRPAPC